MRMASEERSEWRYVRVLSGIHYGTCGRVVGWCGRGDTMLLHVGTREHSADYRHYVPAHVEDITREEYDAYWRDRAARP